MCYSRVALESSHDIRAVLFIIKAKIQPRVIDSHDALGETGGRRHSRQFRDAIRRRARLDRNTREAGDDDVRGTRPNLRNEISRRYRVSLDSQSHYNDGEAHLG